MGTTGEPCWIHLFTADVDTAVSFYGELFELVGRRAERGVSAATGCSSGATSRSPG